MGLPPTGTESELTNTSTETTELPERLNNLSAEDLDDNAHWDLIIHPKRHLLDINFREIWDYRDLLYMFVKRDIVTLYKQTILGPIWFFIQPIMTTVVYLVVFGRIANISTDGLPGVLFYLCGIVIWNYFAESFNKTSGTFTSNAAIFGKVYFPRLIVPLSLVTSGLIKFIIQFGLFLVIFVYYLLSTDLLHPNAWILATPWVLLLMAGLGLGFGIIFSSLTTKYRDLTFITSFGVQLAMYGTPIIYPMSLLSERAQNIMWWNPLAHLIETMKYGFLGAGTTSVAGIAYATTFTATVLLIGIVVFNRTEQTFMDSV